MFNGRKPKKAKKYNCKFGLLTIKEIAYKLGVCHKNLEQYIYNYGVDEAINRAESNMTKFYIYRGERLSRIRLSRVTGVCVNWINKNLKFGEDVTIKVDGKIAKLDNGVNSAAGVNLSVSKAARKAENLTSFAACRYHSN